MLSGSRRRFSPSDDAAKEFLAFSDNFRTNARTERASHQELQAPVILAFSTTFARLPPPRAARAKRLHSLAQAFGEELQIAGTGVTLGAPVLKQFFGCENPKTATP
jgi:hypothetical protein